MEEDPAQRNLDPNYDEEEEEEQNTEEKIKTHWNPLFLRSAIKGDLVEMKKCLDKKANILYEEKRWNALIWACSKGHVEVVRFLLENGAGAPYLPKEEKLAETTTNHFSIVNQDNASDKLDKKAGQGVINNSARPTPLQWACFKGHEQIVWLLLKEGLNLLEADAFGNNAIHQSVAGGHVKIVQTLLQYGIRIDYKNNRGHTVFDLCTEPSIMKYLQEYDAATACTDTKKPFGPKDIKYLCIITGKYFSEEASQLYWIYERKDSTVREKFERRSNKAQEQILKIEAELDELVKSYDYPKLCEKLSYVSAHKIHVGVKELDKAYIHQEKLRTQIMIHEQIDSLKEVENYKTIKKSINTISDLIEDAKSRGVELDQDLLDKSSKEVQRLTSERNLRFELDNPQISKSSKETIENFKELKQVAVDKGVANKYCEEYDELLERMEKNIKANEIITNFVDHPVRDWYPPPHYFDPKTKKAMDAVTRKPIDPALLKPPPVKKKKGKKAPKFMIPKWAENIPDLESDIKSLEQLLPQASTIELDQEAMAKAVEHLDRMKKELRYRKQLAEEEKIEAEKAKSKKKN